MELENREICEACGGKCCKKCGCNYLPKDFSELGFNYLYNLLQEGNISITSVLVIDRLKDGQFVCTPVLNLRVRNTDRPIVDLVSLKTKCSLLTETGCIYDFEHRPSAAKTLVPVSGGKCTNSVSEAEMILHWMPYQKVLTRLVKRLSGMNLNEKLKLDVENFFFDILEENFDNVSRDEIHDCLHGLPVLSNVFYDEFKNAEKRHKGYSKIKTNY